MKNTHIEFYTFKFLPVYLNGTFTILNKWYYSTLGHLLFHSLWSVHYTLYYFKFPKLLPPSSISADDLASYFTENIERTEEKLQITSTTFIHLLPSALTHSSLQHVIIWEIFVFLCKGNSSIYELSLLDMQDHHSRNYPFSSLYHQLFALY